MKKILITGAFGFVGSNLSAYLADRGYELWALDVGVGSAPIRRVRQAHRRQAQGRRVRECAHSASASAYTRSYTWEELEEIPWSEVYTVVHLAGKAHDTRNTGDPQSYFDVNVGLTQRVLEMFSRQGAKAQRGGDHESSKVGADSAAGESKVLHSTFQVPHPAGTLCASAPLREQRFILFSSVKAVADSVEGVLVEEAVPCPQTAYGQSKLAAERFLQPQSGLNDEGKKGSGCRLRTYALRPCMIHGPGNKGNLNLLYKVVRSGMPWPLGAFENQRSFASIENVCAVVEGLISGDVESGIFQVADDEALSTNGLIELMAESQAKLPRLWRISPRLISLIAGIGDVLHLPLNSERLKKLTESYVVSNVKIKKALGWERMPVGAREGMERTLESFSRKGAKAQRLRVEEG